MTDGVVSFRGGEFYGSLEVRGKFDALSKELRIQRLKEVREQERLIAQKRCSTYRQCIDGRKASKTEVIREQKRSVREDQLNELTQKWRSAAEESGLAHRLAKSRSDAAMKKSVETTKIAIKRAAEEQQRSQVAEKIRHENILAAQRESLRLLALQQVKKEFRQSEREDAHAIGETYAARQQLQDLKAAALERMHSVPAVYTQRRVQQGAVSIEQRFPVEVHARVVRHGVRGHGYDATVIHNSATVAEITILRKNWQLVMREMQNKIRTRVRAKTAQHTVERNRGVVFLDSELHQLEIVDKAPGRQHRLNSALCVQPDAEAPRLQSTFEKMFMSKPVRLDPQEAIYRTGSHLMQAALEGRGSTDGINVPVGFPGFSRTRAEEPYPHWASTPGQMLSRGAHYPIAEHDDASSSTSASSVLSSEVEVLYRRHAPVVHEYADGEEFHAPTPREPAAAPPRFTVHDVPATVLSRPAAAVPGWEPQAPQRRADGQFQEAAYVPAVTAPARPPPPPSLQVRVPQVSAGIPTDSATAASDSTASSPKFAPKQVDDSSEASSTFEEEDGPLSINVRGILHSGDLNLPGSVTPPRHSSTRPGARGGRVIDPFTPPEVHEPRPTLAPRSPTAMVAGADRAGTPLSTASSTHTEQARHDRAVRSPEDLWGSSRPHSLRIGTDSPSSASASSEEWRGSRDSRSAGSQGGGSGPAMSIDDRDRGVDVSADAMNISGLTEQMLLDTSLESLPAAQASVATSSASSVRSSARYGSLATSSQSSSRLESSAGINASSELDARSSVGGSHSSRSSGSASASQSQSGSSGGTSSSSSMLSYLQSSPMPPARAPAHIAGHATASPIQLAPGVTITIGSSGQATRNRALDASPAHSLESDSVSMLSGMSDDYRYAAAPRRGGEVPPAVPTLSRREVEEALRDLSSDRGSSEASVDVPMESPARSTGALDSQPAAPSAASPYDAMFDSWEEDQHRYAHMRTRESAALQAVQEEVPSDSDEESEEETPPAPAPARSHSGREMEEVSEDEDSGPGGIDSESEKASVRTETTNELFDKWQSLYQDSENLGGNARALRTEYVAAYTAKTGHTASVVSSNVEDSSFLSSVAPEESAYTSAGRSVRATAPASVPASPLDVFSLPPSRQASHISRSPHVPLQQTSRLRSGSSSERSLGSQSSDSLSPSRGTGDGAHLRDSYDYSRADSIISALDKLSSELGSKLGGSVLESPARSVPQARQMPTSPPIYQMPASLQRTEVAGNRAYQIPMAASAAAPAPHSGASLSSLSGPPSPPDEAPARTSSVPVAPTSAATAVTMREPARNVYAGRLVVHTEQRAAAATDLRHLSAQLGLDDSLLSSQSSTGSRDKPDVRADLSSDEEGDDPSLEELLRSPFTTGATMGALRNEFSGLMDRMRTSLPSASATDSARLTTFVASTAERGASQPPAAVAPGKGGAQSSGEDTYSSGNYFSARNTSSSTAHTASSGFDAQAVATLPSAPERTTGQRSGFARSTLTVHTEVSSVAVSRTAVTTTTTASSSGYDALRVHNARASAAGQQSPVTAARSATVASPGLDTTPPPQDRSLSTPGATGDSRLSEYAMLSTHTLSTTRSRSPGDIYGGQSFRHFPHSRFDISGADTNSDYSGSAEKSPLRK